MNCHDASARFSDLRDGRLSGVGRTELEGHLAICPACRREWAHFQETIEALHGLTPVEPSPGFASRVRAQIETPPWPRRLVRRLFVPWQVKLPLEAVALLLLAIGTVLIYQRSPEMRQVVERPGPQQPAVPVEPERRDAAPDLTPAYKKARKGEPSRQVGPLMRGTSGSRADEVAPQAKADLDTSVGAVVRKPPLPEKSPLAAPSPPPAGAPADRRETILPSSPLSQSEARPVAPREAEESTHALSAPAPPPALQPFRIMTLRTRDVAVAEERVREWVQQAGGRLLDPSPAGEPIQSGQRAFSVVIPTQAVARFDALLAELGQLFGKEQEVPRSNEALISLTISPKSPPPAESE